eukprot:EG_transcript_14270
MSKVTANSSTTQAWALAALGHNPSDREKQLRQNQVEQERRDRQSDVKREVIFWRKKRKVQKRERRINYAVLRRYRQLMLDQRQVFVYWDVDTTYRDKEVSPEGFLAAICEAMQRLVTTEELSVVVVALTPATLARLTGIRIRTGVDTLLAQPGRRCWQCNFCDSTETFTDDDVFVQHYMAHIEELKMKRDYAPHNSRQRQKYELLLQNYTISSVLNPREGSMTLPVVSHPQLRLAVRQLRSRLQRVNPDVRTWVRVIDGNVTHREELLKVVRRALPQTVVLASNNSGYADILAGAKRDGWNIISLTASSRLAQLSQVAVSLLEPC